MRLTFNLIFFLGVGLLVGCKDYTEQTQQKIQDINKTATTKVKPLPDFEESTVAPYDPDGKRSPFWPLSIFNEYKGLKSIHFVADPNRSPQYLEQFSLDSLTVFGYLNKDNVKAALIKTPDGRLSVAKVGDYIGFDHGRISNISSKGISVVEAVSAGGDRFISREKFVPVSQNDSHQSQQNPNTN